MVYVKRIDGEYPHIVEDHWRLQSDMKPAYGGDARLGFRKIGQQ